MSNLKLRFQSFLCLINNLFDKIWVSLYILGLKMLPETIFEKSFFIAFFLDNIA